MTDFLRINRPRVDKIGAMIATIRKSARSQKIGAEDVAELLAPLIDEMGATPTQAKDAPPVKPPATLRETPHIQQIAGFVASLPRDHLPSYITHLVNRLCEQSEGGS